MKIIRIFRWGCAITSTISILLFQSSTINAQVPCEVFREDFNGSTTFEEKLLPYGTPAACAFVAGAIYDNNGTEEFVTLYSYFESCLRKKGLNIPAGQYIITLKWRFGPNGANRTNSCNLTNFDDRWGATCTVPNRVVAVNDVMIYEKPGNQQNFQETVSIIYTGRIDSIDLAVVGNCSVDPYHTYYDYLTIVDTRTFPQVNFGYTVSERTVTFSDSTQNAGTNTLKWYFGDGDSSSEQNPIHTYTTDSTYTVCLISSNSCGADTLCKEVTIGGGGPTGFSNTIKLNQSLLLYPNPSGGDIFIGFTENELNKDRIKVYAALGQVINTPPIERLNSRLVRMNTSMLVPGVYMVVVKDDDGFITQKIVIYR